MVSEYAKLAALVENGADEQRRHFLEEALLRVASKDLVIERRGKTQAMLLDKNENRTPAQQSTQGEAVSRIQTVMKGEQVPTSGPSTQ